MKSAKSLAALLFTAAMTAGTSQAQGWRGLIPLRSTRADVERRLGAPIRPGFASLYDTDKARVSVFYSQGVCTEGKGGWKVAPDTVINIAVFPRGELLISDIGQVADLSLDGGGFTRAPDPRLPGSVTYFNDGAGVNVSTWESAGGERVQSINYGPTAADRHLRCSDSSEGSGKQVFDPHTPPPPAVTDGSTGETINADSAAVAGAVAKQHFGLSVGKGWGSPDGPLNCEMNFQNLEHVRNMIRERGEWDGVLILIARLGDEETRHEINRRRLYNVREKLTREFNVPREKIIIGEGERVKGFGRVEFYLGSGLLGALPVSRQSDICVGCCGPDERFYPYRDKLERKSQQRKAVNPKIRNRKSPSIHPSH